MKKLKRVLLFTALSASIALTAFGAVACEEEHTQHNWDGGIITKRATCGVDGVRQYTCTVCKETKDETIAATGEHAWDEGKITTEATCAKTGAMTYTCTVCKKTKEETIAATGEHTWNEGVSTATCAEAGKITYTCTVCQETKEEDALATGHVWGKDGYCTVCKEYSGTDVTVLNAEGKPAAGVIVIAANEKEGVLYKAVTDDKGFALMVGLKDKNYQVQLYDLPEGTGYDVQTVSGDNGDQIKITLKSGEVAKFESESKNEITSTGAYSVTVPLDHAEIDGEPMTGKVPIALTCDYIGGAKYVISWKETCYPLIEYTKGVYTSDPYSADNAEYDEASGIYSFSLLLSYNESATVNFGGYLEDFIGGFLATTDFPYTYSFNVNILEPPAEGSEDLPLTLNVGENAITGFALEDGSGYYVYTKLAADKAGDYTFEFGENTKITYSNGTEEGELQNGGKISVALANTYRLYVVSDQEKIDLKVTFSYTPGSADAPYTLKVGENTATGNADTFFTFTPETTGKYTLRSSGDISFNVYGSKEAITAYPTEILAHGTMVAFSYEAGKTYYICALNGGTEFTFTEYNAKTDSGFDKNDPRVLTLDEATVFEGEEFYYKFTANQDGNYKIKIDSTIDMGTIYIYTDSNFETLFKEGYRTSLIFKATAGTTYYIRVFPYGSGTVTVTETEEEAEKQGKAFVLDEIVTLIPLEYENWYFFTATEDGEYELTASEDMAMIYQTDSSYDIGTAKVHAKEYTFTATAGETYYFSIYSGDGGTITLSVSSGKEEITIHGTFEVGENSFTALRDYNESYNATMNVTEEGKYTFKFESAAEFWNYAEITIVVNGTTHTEKANSRNGYTLEIDLPAEEVTISIFCSVLGANITLTIS